jgi:3-oxoacyl-[acyl-carrier-protein] synthase III
MTRFARITGTGSCLPPNRLTNADMVDMLGKRGVETSDDWRRAARPWLQRVCCRPTST